MTQAHPFTKLTMLHWPKLAPLLKTNLGKRISVETVERIVGLTPTFAAIVLAKLEERGVVELGTAVYHCDDQGPVLYRGLVSEIESESWRCPSCKVVPYARELRYGLFALVTDDAAKIDSFAEGSP